MGFFIAVCLTVIVGYTGATPDIEADWSAYKTQFGKSYEPDEDKVRMENFLKTANKIAKQNGLFDEHKSSFFLKHDQFSDWSAHEFKTNLLGLSNKTFKDADKANHSFSNSTPGTYNANLTTPLPDFIDWRESGILGKVKNQKNCGSCYAFSVVGALEAVIALRFGKKIDLSAQQVIDCSYMFNKVKEVNKGCDAGTLGVTMNYIQQNGITTSSEYPYVSGDTHKHYTCKKGSVFYGKGLENIKIPRGDTHKLAEALATYGPVATKMNGAALRNYGGGIIDFPDCIEARTHSVLLVGYGKQDDEDYWIGMNSWGPSWGDHGFFKIRRGVAMCGIETAQGHVPAFS